MAIVMHVEVKGMGATKEEVETFTGLVLDRIKTFPGFIAHASGPIEGGYYVTEFWESQEAHERWAREEVEPAMLRLSGGQPFQGPLPQIQYLPAYDVITR